VHLPAKRQLEVVALYHEGVPVKEIAEQFKIHRATVGEICKRHGVQLRNPNRGMDDAQIRVATHTYESGASLATVGKQLGLSVGTVRRALLGAGVKLRSRPGR